MTKVYVMESCPDCIEVKKQLTGNPNYQIIDIGESLLNLKSFIHLRDTHPAFDKIKEVGSLGIPCFVANDGAVTFHLDTLIIPDNSDDKTYCTIDGKGC